MLPVAPKNFLLERVVLDVFFFFLNHVDEMEMAGKQHYIQIPKMYVLVFVTFYEIFTMKVTV